MVIKGKLTELLFVDGIHLITHIRNNMKNVLMSMSDKIMLRKRALIETVNNKLKNICQIEHSRHRSFTNFLSNLIAGFIAYSYLRKKPAIKYRNNNNFIQLTLFWNQTQVIYPILFKKFRTCYYQIIPLTQKLILSEVNYPTFTAFIHKIKVNEHRIICRWLQSRFSCK